MPKSVIAPGRCVRVGRRHLAFATVEALREARARRPRRTPTKNFRPGYRNKYGRVVEGLIVEAETGVKDAVKSSLGAIGKPNDVLRREDAVRFGRLLHKRLDEMLVPIAAKVYAVGVQKAVDWSKRRAKEARAPRIADTDPNAQSPRHQTTMASWLGLVAQRTQDVADGIAQDIEDMYDGADAGFDPTLWPTPDSMLDRWGAKVGLIGLGLWSLYQAGFANQMADMMLPPTGPEDTGLEVGGMINYVAVGDANTCDPCAANAEGSPYYPDEVPIPGEDCDGGDRCRCELEPDEMG